MCGGKEGRREERYRRQSPQQGKREGKWRRGQAASVAAARLLLLLAVSRVYLRPQSRMPYLAPDLCDLYMGVRQVPL